MNAHRHFTLWRSALLPLAFIYVLVMLTALVFGPNGRGLPPAERIDVLAGWTRPLLSSSLALGFVVMAIIQLLKPELRALLHIREIVRWLQFGGDESQFSAIWFLDSVGRREQSRSAIWFLDSVGRREQSSKALLELPIEQLAAQIQASVDMDLTLNGKSGLLEAVLGKNWAERFRSVEYPKDRTAASYLIQRRLDDLQIQTRRRWRHLLRTLTLGLALGVTTLITSTAGLWRENLPGTAFLVLLISILGSIFASTARDVVAAIERVRS